MEIIVPLEDNYIELGGFVEKGIDETNVYDCENAIEAYIADTELTLAEHVSQLPATKVPAFKPVTLVAGS